MVETPKTFIQRARITLTALLHGQIHLPQTHTLIFFAVVVGVSAAVAAVGFITLIRTFTNLFVDLSGTTFYGIVTQQRYWVPLIPAIGGLLVAPLLIHVAREAKGYGVPEVMNAVARHGGVIRPRVTLVKALSSAICLGSGGSAGPEGPIVQIGSAIGSTVGQVFQLSSDRLRVLVGCGAAAGISAIFNAPISGAIFTLEIIMGDFSVRTFAPVLISSVVASVVSRSALGDYPAFQVPAYEMISGWELPLYAVMGALIGCVAVMFMRALSWTENFSDNLKCSPYLKPALGGLVVGVIGIFFPQIFAAGYETITQALEGNMVWGLLAALLILKIVATSLTLGSGSSGGIFAPTLFIGAMSGGIFGNAVARALPGHDGAVGTYALVGMAASIAGATHAPLTAILIIFELSNDYRIVLPLMIAVVFATLVAQKMERESIYTIKLAKQGINLRGGKDVDILRSLTASDVMDVTFTTVPTTATTTELLAIAAKSDDSYFLVIDPDGNLYGSLSLGDLRRAIVSGADADKILAQDISTTPLLVTPDDTLEEVQSLLGRQGLMFAPVVDLRDPGRVIGVVREEKILRVYNRRLLEQL